MTGWIIREERPGDRAAIGALLTSAFGGPAEAALAAALRDADAAPVSLVAEAGGGRIVGHVLFSPLAVEGAAGEIAAAALAPLAVADGWRRRGIGAALCEAGIGRCRELGLAGVVVLGDPGYYRRFGFDLAAAAGLVCPWSGPHLMALEFRPGALGGAGRLRYHPAFEGLGR
ncbi:MAG: GNAT family N-acetyltransferase [Chloroflexota bacterium]